CYILTGRGVVEASAWGYRVPIEEHPEEHPTPPPSTENQTQDYILSASRTRTDGVSIVVNPPFLEDLSELFVSPDVPPNVPANEELCPQKGQSFSQPPPNLRYLRVMDRYFNGRTFFDSRASLEIDLCYFLVSKRTLQVVSRGIGYRPIAEEFNLQNKKSKKNKK
ncbi:MAG TPA: hypothetical protein PLJ21_09850, partial [Pseudobdellovibrionaceae bacterium]|nr:hypothetical protein [Pseudobdellovibrionaceae bacterium]